MADWHGHRRSLLRLAVTFVAGGAARRLLGSTPGSFEPLIEKAGGGSISSGVGQYQVNATITLAGISIFSKKNIGGAVLAHQQSTAPDCVVTALQFAAGSWPDRLKGLNRFGMTEEVVREQSGAVLEAAYVSFMSSSPEKNLSEARKAFASQECVPLTVAIGHSSAKGYVAELQHDDVPGNYDWRNCQDVMDNIRTTALCGNTRADLPALPTFLYAVRKAIAVNDGQPVLYAHNAKVYDVRTRAGGKSRNEEIEIIGRIFSEADRSEVEFKVWMREGEAAGLPIRIQWKARSFLLLTLEADSTVKSPELRSLLRRAQA